ncbi:putative reverse transcriptase domain-containing protein [Tanacetum coccineum]
MPPKKTTAATTPMTDAQIKALISQGVAGALAKRDVARSRNDNDSHDSGGDGRRRMPFARETVKHDVAYAMPWKTLKRMMTDKYCPRGEIKKLKIEIWNLKVKGSAMAYKLKKMQDAIEFGTEPIDQKIRTLAERQAKNKRKFKDTSRNNQNQQQPFKRHNVARAYTAGPGKKKLQPVAANNNQRAQEANQRVLTCFECGAQGHFKSNFPKLKNKNQGNQAGNGNAVARAYAVGTAETNPNLNFVTATFLLNNHYASVLFDTGADRSFVNTLLRGCTLIFLNYPFNFDLMPIEMGSFDVIIGMDWLLKYHAIIVCDEKIVRIPFGNEILIVHGDESNNGYESRLNIISCTKTQKYLLKGCPIFLAHVTMKKAEDKSEEKRLEDVPIV